MDTENKSKLLTVIEKPLEFDVQWLADLIHKEEVVGRLH